MAPTPAESGFRSEKVDYLSRFHEGEYGTIVDMNSDGELQGRLMGLGLFVGTRFQLLRGSDSMKKPLIMAIGESRIVLGPEIAATILVEQ